MTDFITPKDYENHVELIQADKIAKRTEFMRIYRKHAMVVVLILSAIITPPDISSQILVSFPLIILYEFSIKISSRVIKKQNKQQS